MLIEIFPTFTIRARCHVDNRFRRGTGKSACHLRSSANTGCAQVVNLKKFSAVTCMQNNSLACSLILVMLASACICEHLGTR